jgi:uncharacterized protein
MTESVNSPHGAAHVPEKTVKCPNCGGPSLYAVRNAFRPFCCERCKLGDLGHWASETFRVEAPPSNDAEDFQ